MFKFEKFFLSNFNAQVKFLWASDLNKNYEIQITKLKVFEFMFLLKNCEFLQFNQLIDVVAHDRLSFKKRFNLIYVISSVVNNCKFFISLQTAEGSPIFSVVNLFESASWIEREVWDMFGIYVLGNNDFRRILSDYGFKGHPLRKDYPLSGYYEVLFDGHYNNISYFPVEFMQEFRNFEFQNFWGENNTEIL